MPDKVIFYDLVPRQGSRLFYSPNTMKTRLSLLHKGVDFETKAVTYQDLKSWLKERTGFDRVFSPLIELPDGRFMQDSWKIAEWLEETYPSAPSLFLPGSTTPDETALRVAKNFATMFSAGFGDSDSMWSTFLELSAEPLRSLMDEETAKYFSSDEKNGPGAWAALTSKNPKTNLEHAKASVLPLNATLANTKFLTGNEPGFVDYIAYGRYIMMACAVPDLTQQVWKNSAVPRVAEWLKSIEERYADGLKEVLDELPKA